MARVGKRKICVFIGSRANYGSARAVMKAIQAHPKLELQVVAGASALIDRYGSIVDTIEKDGFPVNERVFMLLEGGTPLTMAKTTGIGLGELASAFDRLRPDFVLVVGDRYEVLAAATAAVYLNIPLAHTMGGEVSGTIDESIRHAITKLAHVHFPASKDARARIVRMGEDPKRVFLVGCPRMDEVKRILGQKRSTLRFDGVGEAVDLEQPFLFVSQHPVTTEYEQAGAQIEETLKALVMLGMPTIMLWPNSDAGTEKIASRIRRYRERQAFLFPTHFFKNLALEDYFVVMQKTACMIGNSSSLVREGSFIGTPGVMVGTRQNAREHGKNLITVGHNAGQIVAAVKKQLRHGAYKPSTLYGTGTAGKQIADTLAKVQVSIQKTFHN